MFQILSTPQSPSLNCHCLLGSHKRISLPTLQSLCPSGTHICLSWMVPIPLQHCNQSPGSSTQSCMQGHSWLPLLHPLLTIPSRGPTPSALKLTLEHQTLYSFECALRLPPDFSSLYALAIRNVPCRLKKKPSWRSFCSSATKPLPSPHESLITCPPFPPWSTPHFTVSPFIPNCTGSSTARLQNASSRLFFLPPSDIQWWASYFLKVTSYKLQLLGKKSN